MRTHLHPGGVGLHPEVLHQDEPRLGERVEAALALTAVPQEEVREAGGAPLRPLQLQHPLRPDLLHRLQPQASFCCSCKGRTTVSLRQMPLS